MKRLIVLALSALPSLAVAQTPALAPIADHVFAKWRPAAGPGCAVAVDRPGQPRFTRAYGSAELEFDIPNTPQTIFEAGSVSKQFTAAAVVLLALDGKLGLDDDVRRYVPELPRYERTITIRHMLNHTSGLRDWGEIAALAGWPRTTRAHTHAHVLDIIGRQRALNFPPGDRYSYSNSGYNLLAIIVERVSGTSFGVFSRERLFAPMGLTRTEWRDGYTRIVKGRAQAYRPDGEGWRLNMPFEDVQGNGGLLTTVDDLLTWTAMLDKPTARWKPMVDSLHVLGRLTDGTKIDYALGLRVDEYRGVPVVQHSGATAGYRSVLNRFPGHGVAVAVLCNAASAAPGAYADQIADSLLAAHLAPRSTATEADERPPAPGAPWTPSASELAAFVGEYASPDVGTTWRVEVDAGKLTLITGPGSRVALRPLARDRLTGFAGELWFTRDSSGGVTALHVGTGRAHDVVFDRRQARATQQAPRR